MWHQLYDIVLPYVVQIETPQGFGTGFLFSYNQSRSLIGIATAAHVVEHADTWKTPIKIRHHVSKKEVFLTHEDRVIELDRTRDSASILLHNKDYDYLPPATLPMIDPEKIMRPGVEVAWVGYPGIARPHLCLFTGRIGAFVAHDDSYLIDGVAIGGVSGGPVFTDGPDDDPVIVGSISAYIHRGEGLPGLLSAHDVTAFHETIRFIRTMDEARQKKEAEEQQRRESEAPEERVAVTDMNPTATLVPPHHTEPADT